MMLMLKELLGSRDNDPWVGTYDGNKENGYKTQIALSVLPSTVPLLFVGRSYIQIQYVMDTLLS